MFVLPLLKKKSCAVTYSAANRYSLHVQRQLLVRVEHARGLPVSHTAAQTIEAVVDNRRAGG